MYLGTARGDDQSAQAASDSEADSQRPGGGGGRGRRGRRCAAAGRRGGAGRAPGRVAGTPGRQVLSAAVCCHRHHAVQREYICATQVISEYLK